MNFQFFLCILIYFLCFQFISINFRNVCSIVPKIQSKHIKPNQSYPKSQQQSKNLQNNTTMQPTQQPPTVSLQLQQSQNPQPIQKKPQHLITGIPEHYTTNPHLTQALQILPPHYNFQLHKTLYRIEQLAQELGKSKLSVSLQFPEGLMLYACIIADLIKAFSLQINDLEVSIVIMGDVTYGACCVDDIASDLMQCDLMVHYGHSCLVPITQTRRKVLYVFVEIQIDIQHFIQTCIYNFTELKNQTLYLMSTIQFNNSLFLAKQKLTEAGFTNLIIPQEKPRSAGQVLGCTSPSLSYKQDTRNIVIFLCDGRFHMQAAMIANPKFQFYQYDPYTRLITEEKYATDLMIKRRSQEIQRARNGQTKSLCFILGTLGRQGNPEILNRLITKIQGHYEYMILLASEINTQLLNILPVDFYVQIACPRLSIDWSYGTPKPLLTPYELFVLIDKINIKEHYSMDFYSMNGGPWSNFYGRQAPKAVKKVVKTKAKVQLKMDDGPEKNQEVKGQVTEQK